MFSSSKQKTKVISEVPPFTATIEGREYNLPGVSEAAVRQFAEDHTYISVTVYVGDTPSQPPFRISINLGLVKWNDLHYEFYENCAYNDDLDHLLDEAEAYHKQYESELPDDALREWVQRFSGGKVKTLPVPSQEIGNQLMRAYYAHFIHHGFDRIQLAIRQLGYGGKYLYVAMDDDWAMGRREHRDSYP